jgi:hypothetical protein
MREKTSWSTTTNKEHKSEIVVCHATTACISAEFSGFKRFRVLRAKCVRLVLRRITGYTVWYDLRPLVGDLKYWYDTGGSVNDLFSFLS